MLTQINLDQCAGKTVLGVAGMFEDRLITFTDGTFVHFSAAHGYDGSVEMEDRKYDVGRSDVSHEACVAAGLFTETELATLLQQKDAEWKRNKELQERQEFERLKSKYGPASTSLGSES